MLEGAIVSEGIVCGGEGKKKKGIWCLEDGKREERGGMRRMIETKARVKVFDGGGVRFLWRGGSE